MATRKTTRTLPPAVSTSTPPATKARRPAAQSRAKRQAPESPAAVASAAPTEEEVRVRAYFLSLERRWPAADPRADWLRAEQELAADRATAPVLAGRQ